MSPAPPSRRRRPEPAYRTLPLYGETALWRCTNQGSGQTFTLNGPLAQVLKRHPERFSLTFLSPEGA